MRINVLKSAATVAAVMLMAAALASAKSSQVNFMYSSKISSGLTLKPGNYKVALTQNAQKPELAFYEGRKLVGEVPVKLVPASKKFAQTEVFYSAPHNHIRSVQKIEMNGWNRAFVLDNGSQSR